MWFLQQQQVAAAAAAAAAATPGSTSGGKQQVPSAQAARQQLVLTACVHNHDYTRASGSAQLYTRIVVAAAQALLRRRLRSCYCLRPPHILQHVCTSSGALPCALASQQTS
jgi:hypothetical protein